MQSLLMTKSRDMKKNGETDQHICEFCQKEFVRESSILKHVCETKRRYQNRDTQSVRIGFAAFAEFYSRNGNRKKKDFMDFIKSAYYTGFVKFGNYCVDVNVLNTNRYIDWLLDNQIKLDSWNKDSIYTKFIIEYYKTEDPYDAIARSIETTMELSNQEQIEHKDVFRYGNVHKICFQITKGKISPWLLYQSISGLEFIEKLDVTQQKMILDYINPEQWALNFRKYRDIVPDIKKLLQQGGY